MPNAKKSRVYPLLGTVRLAPAHDDSFDVVIWKDMIEGSVRGHIVTGRQNEPLEDIFRDYVYTPRADMRTRSDRAIQKTAAGNVIRMRITRQAILGARTYVLDINIRRGSPDASTRSSPLADRRRRHDAQPIAKRNKVA